MSRRHLQRLSVAVVTATLGLGGFVANTSDQKLTIVIIGGMIAGLMTDASTDRRNG